jgi:hypothetical protein
VCLEEDDRRRDELDRAGDDELIGRLNGLARAGRANVDDSLAHRLQHRPVHGRMIDSDASTAPARRR